MRLTKVKAGKLYKHSRRKDGSTVIYIACCDCGLVHREVYTIHKRYLGIKAWRDDSLTAQVRARRKKHGISK